MATPSNAHSFKLLIVESPVKAKTIKKYLGKNYEVISCNGHIRDLPKKTIAVDIEGGFHPQYIINPEKKAIMKQMSSLAKQASEVLLASDDDREGESIAWHLTQALALNKKKTQRIVFREITKKAIKEAVTHPRTINMDLVYSQQARRILDRLVGYEISPLLWRKIKAGLSAGRVQTVAVRLVVERERAIRTFVPTPSFQVSARFTLPDGTPLEGHLQSNLSTYEEAQTWLTACQKARFIIQDIQKKPGIKNPAAPLTTSTLQQLASTKLGYSVARTTTLAQRLYEEGHITYMRTDSVNLSEEVLSTIGEIITKEYGKAYHTLRRYKTKSKVAQEAHEAIRPTRVDQKIVTQDPSLQRLYTLIRTRTLASQMTAVSLERTTVVIQPDNQNQPFITKGEIITFDGFLALGKENKEKSNKALPLVTVGDDLSLAWMQAREHFTKPPKGRYSESSLVAELEEKGIGRPSTYAPTIHTIQQRNYVVRDSREGEKRTCRLLTVAKGKVTASQEEETYGTAKNKLFPTDIAMTTNDFLVKKFKDITNYKFTAEMEDNLDAIAHKKQGWQAMLTKFYKDFSPKVAAAMEADRGVDLVRTLGNDPTTGKVVMARLSRRYGPMVQLGELDGDEKPRFTSLRSDQLLETITLEEALVLFQLPRNVGTFETMPIIAQIGRFGPYLKHHDKFYSLGQEHNVYTIEEKEAIEVIEAKRKAEAASLIKTFPEQPDLQVRKGRWGYYLKTAKGNFKIDAKIDPTTLTHEACHKIIAEAPTKKKRTKRFNKK